MKYLLDGSGNVLAKYVYDAYGKVVSVVDANGNAITDWANVAHLNPFRYRSYYYDFESGLYYVGSRYYDPVLCRWLNADSQLNTSLGVLGTNLYAYCLNNPSNKIDNDGRKPGDLFDTMDEAARDFAIYINAKSISDNREYAAAIYSVKTTVKTYETSTKVHRFLWRTWTSTSIKTIKTTKIQYTYKEPTKGSKAGASVPSAPLFKKRTAIMHTHAAYDPNYLNDMFSSADKSAADKLRIPIYVATPLGTLRKYDPATGYDIELFNDIPFDSNHPFR